MRRIVRTGRILLDRGEMPPGLTALLVFGIMPLPLFFDEIALVVAVIWAWVKYRTHVHAAWVEAGLTNATR